MATEERARVATEEQASVLIEERAGVEMEGDAGVGTCVFSDALQIDAVRKQNLTSR